MTLHDPGLWLLLALLCPVGGFVLAKIIGARWWHRYVLGHVMRCSVPVPHCIETRCECGDRWEDWS